MNIRVPFGLVRRRLLSSAYVRPISWGARGPVISFAFDDFPRTALTVGGKILKNYGVKGTYYASIGLMNTANELGEQFQRGDLDTLQEEGHELASHTFSHISSRSVSSGTFVRDVAKGRAAIKELTGRCDSGSFAFPFGDVTLTAKRAVGNMVGSSRGIWAGANGPDVDLNLLRANSLYGGRDKVDEVKNLISENERQKDWLIFYSHDVQMTPSRFGCTPALLELAVSFALRCGTRVLRVSDVVTELTGLGPDRPESDPHVLGLK